MRMRIVVDAGTLRRPAVGPSTGELWTEFGDFAFPARHWDDFVVVILDAWVGAVLRVVSGAAGFERIHFMDGPFELTFARLRPGALLVRAIERGTIVRASAETSDTMLAAELLDASELIVPACHLKGDRSIEAQRLEHALTPLRAAIV